MDGSPSAPDSEPESPELTEGRSRPSDTERELNELRARAYGPQADIEADPAAMARLIELEDARVSAAAAVRHNRIGFASAADASTAVPPAAGSTVLAPPAAVEPEIEMPPIGASRSPWLSLRERARATPGRTWWFVAAAVVVVGVVVSVTTWPVGPRLDATLQPTAVEPDSAIVDVLEFRGRSPDPSTLRQFEPYHGVDAWAIETRDGDVCLGAWDGGGSGRSVVQCASPGIDHSVHMRVGPKGTDGFGEWLPEGSTISFHLREDTVDVFVRAPSPAD